MSDGTDIEWTDATWNPVRGCSRVSEGCRNCYAERAAARFSGPGLPYEGLAANGKWTGKTRLVSEHLDDPLRWKRPRRIFVNSMSDLFHESLAFDAVLRVFEVMERAKQHTFQVLTKRPKRMVGFFGGTSGGGLSAPALPNVWLGVSVENQAAADERIPLLLETPAAVRFLSCEPLLGPVTLRPSWMAGYDYSGGYKLAAPRIDWIIAGGESGPGARPMHPDWARSLRDQCAVAGVPFFFKQWGEWQATFPNGLDADPLMLKSGKRAAGRLLDGVEHNAFPVRP